MENNAKWPEINIAFILKYRSSKLYIWINYNKYLIMSEGSSFT